MFVPSIYCITLLFILRCVLPQPIQTFRADPLSGTWLTSHPEPNGRSTCHHPNSHRHASFRCLSNSCGHCELALWYVFHLFSLFPFLFTDTPLWHRHCVRAPLSKATSASHAMHGKPATPMLTLQWLATGLRSACLANGPLKLVFSGSFKWTQPITAHVWARLCTKFAIAFESWPR